MSSLTTSIVALGFATERDVEEALARQVMYGGDLVDNLLELQVVDEAQVMRSLEDATGLTGAPHGELPAPSDEARRCVSPDLAKRHRVLPLKIAQGALVVVVGDPLPEHVLHEVEEAAKHPVQQWVAPTVRVLEGLARHYGADLPERVQRILGRLAGRSSVGPVQRGPTVDFKSLPRPQSIIPPVALSDSFDVPTGPPPVDYERLTDAPPPPDAARRASSQAPRPTAPRHLVHRRGPYTAAMVEEDLLHAETPEEVVAAFFDFAAQYFESSALFMVQGNEATGRFRRGGAAGRQGQIERVRVPLDLESSFSQAVKSKSFRLARLRAGGVEGGLARDLGRVPGRQILLLPVAVRHRVVIVLYGDHGTEDVLLDAVGDVISMASLVSRAIERIILERKRGGQPSRVVAAPPRAKMHRPSRAERAQALADLVSQGHEFDEGLEPVAAPPAHVPSEQAATTRREGPRRTKTTQESLAAPPPVGSNTGAHEPIPQDVRAWRHSSVPGFSPSPRGTLPGFPAPAPLPVTLEDAPPPSDSLPTGHSPSDRPLPGRPTVSLGPPSPTRPGTPPSDYRATFGITDEQLPSDVPQFSEQEEGTTLGYANVPTLPSQPPPAMAQPEGPNPADLVDELCGGDDRALAELLRNPEQAVAALAARFPGPVPVAMRRDGKTKASECGPVLHALAKLGAPAVPFLVVRTADEDERVREWATRLLGEMPCPEAARAVARRLVDDAPEVRRAAVSSSRWLQRHPEVRASLRHQIEELASDTALPPAVRRTAVEALTDLREIEAFPLLVDLLSDEAREVSRGAHWALVVLARQDFGEDRGAWLQFWEINNGRHRVEWLMDALTHDNRDIRRAAGDELKSLTMEYFGYYDDLPPAEREKAQERYRDWWKSEGAARFAP